jgi:hypothetical protein
VVVVVVLEMVVHLLINLQVFAMYKPPEVKARMEHTMVLAEYPLVELLAALEAMVALAPP